MLEQMLSVQSSSEPFHYGYGLWLGKIEDNKYIPFFQGSDPGVSFISSFDISKSTCITAVSNFGCNVWKLKRDIKKLLILKKIRWG
jgi:hypothetical protein